MAGEARHRQRSADLIGSEVVVPDSDETVATGAAVQAALVTTGADPSSLVERWRLGRGSATAPERDAGAVRARYPAERRR